MLTIQTLIIQSVADNQIIKTKMKRFCLLTLFLGSIIVLMTSCVSTAIKSRRVNPDTDQVQKTNCKSRHENQNDLTEALKGQNIENVKPIEGVAYSLPMVLFHLTAILTNVPDLDASSSNVTITTISNLYTTVTYENQTNTDAIKIITNSESKKVYTNTDFIITNTTTQFVSNSVTMPGLNTGTNKNVYIISVDPIIAPDPDHLYSLKFTENNVSSDTFGVTVDPTNNFLQSINATNADQTVNIVAELVQAAVSIYTMGFGGIGAISPNIRMTTIRTGALSVTNSTTHECKTNWPGRIEVDFDPTIFEGSGGIKSANQTIAEQFGCDLTNCPIQLRAIFHGNTISQTTANYIYAHQPNKAKGVLYRPLQTYILKIDNAFGLMGTDSVQYLLRTPNAAPVFSLPVTRATFVTRTTSITFNNGFLQGVNYNNPSQAAAVLGLPLTVVGDIFSSITNVLQLKLNIATAQSNIATQQTALVNQMAAFNTANSNLLQTAATLNALKSSLTNEP